MQANYLLKVFLSILENVCGYSRYKVINLSKDPDRISKYATERVGKYTSSRRTIYKKRFSLWFFNWPLRKGVFLDVIVSMTRKSRGCFVGCCHCISLFGLELRIARLLTFFLLVFLILFLKHLYNILA